MGHDRPATSDSRIGVRRDRGSEIKPVPAEEAWYRPDPLARVAILTGNRGAGKTVTVNHWAYLMRATNRARGISWKIFSNIPLQYADEWSEDMYERIQGDESGWYKQATVVIDELPEIMSSKRATSGVVVGVEAQIRQLRKDMMDLLGTAQWPHELTSSILRQCDLLIQPQIFKRKVRDRNGRWKEIALVKSAIWNWNGSLTGRPLFGMRWPAPYETADQYRTDYGVERTWNLFDTESKVTNVHTEAGKRAIAERKQDREWVEVASSLFNGRRRVEYEEFEEYATAYLGCHSSWMYAEAIRRMRLTEVEEAGTQYLELPYAILDDLDTAEARQARHEAEMEELRLNG